MNWIELIGTVTTVLAVWGTWLNARRRRACFTIWLFSNAGSAVLHVALGAYSLAARDAIFFVLAIYGLFAWRTPQATEFYQQNRVHIGGAQSRGPLGID